MFDRSLRRSAALGLATVLMAGCAGPPPAKPGSPDGERRGPPPFSVLDLNQDGVLRLDEFQRHAIPQGDHAEIFRTIDADADGIVTQAEYDSHRPPPPR